MSKKIEKYKLEYRTSDGIRDTVIKSEYVEGEFEDVVNYTERSFIKSNMDRKTTTLWIGSQGYESVSITSIDEINFKKV